MRSICNIKFLFTVKLPCLRDKNSDIKVRQYWQIFMYKLKFYGNKKEELKK
jgi:hypothetical protein